MRGGRSASPLPHTQGAALLRFRFRPLLRFQFLPPFCPSYSNLIMVSKEPSSESAVLSALELKIPPAVLGAVTVLLMWLATRGAPTLTFGIPHREWISATLALLGAIIAVAGVVSFRRARTTVNPTTPAKASSLVVSGIYRFTRNPMYLGFALILLALAVFFSNALALALVPCFVLYLDRFQIRPEERALASLFPNDFPAYTARVRRWF